MVPRPVTFADRIHRFTKDEAYRLEAMQFWPGKRFELIGGRIVLAAAQSNHAAAAIDAMRKQLEIAFGDNYWVRTRGTLDLTESSVVDPDLAVVPVDYLEEPLRANPTTALLVVEVSDAPSLVEDRALRGSLYASVGIMDYWIVNIPDRQLEIRRDPQPDSAQEFGYGYASLQTLKPGASAAPLAAPQGAIPVERLFFA